MDKYSFIGWISGLITTISVVPYGIRIWQRKTRPAITTWILLSLLGLTFLLTYRSSGANTNIWPAVAGFVNPVIVTFLAWKRNGVRGKFGTYDWISLALCLVSLEIWIFLQMHNEHLQYALYVAILADAAAMLPTVMSYYRDPSKDRPGAWIIFALGWSVGLLAITDHTFANYALPGYIILAHTVVCIPLIKYRLSNSTLKNEWI